MDHHACTVPPRYHVRFSRKILMFFLGVFVSWWCANGPVCGSGWNRKLALLASRHWPPAQSVQDTPDRKDAQIPGRVPRIFPACPIDGARLTFSPSCVVAIGNCRPIAMSAAESPFCRWPVALSWRCRCCWFAGAAFYGLRCHTRQSLWQSSLLRLARAHSPHRPRLAAIRSRTNWPKSCKS